MGIVVPGILKVFGDIADLAALVAPKQLTIRSPLRPDGHPLDAQSATTIFERTQKTYSLVAPRENFQLTN